MPLQPTHTHPIKEAALRVASTKGGGRLRRPPPFVDSFMDGGGEAGEAQGILNGSNFVAKPRSNFVRLECSWLPETRLPAGLEGLTLEETSHTHP